MNEEQLRKIIESLAREINSDDERPAGAFTTAEFSSVSKSSQKAALKTLKSLFHEGKIEALKFTYRDAIWNGRRTVTGWKIVEGSK